MNIEKLRANLSDEKARLARITKHLHDSRLASAAAEAALERAESELKADAVQAILEERTSPGVDLKKKLTLAQNACAHTRTELGASEEATRLQAEKCEALAAEIAGRAFEEFEMKAKPHVARIHQMMSELSDESAAVRQIQYGCGQDFDSLRRVLFPQIAITRSLYCDNQYAGIVTDLVLKASALKTADAHRMAAVGE